ncbi:MAG: HAMP domain-containing histidine kinase [Bacteroidota bacterium]|nr:HAMP domain-containing histidine kinase [Bacteroidota bacterium]
MKIKYRITILFTAVVTVILLLLCVSVYYFSSLNRQKDVKRRLTNRGLTAISLLIKEGNKSKELLRQIDANIILPFEEKALLVYDYNNNVLVDFKDDTTSTIHVTSEILNKAKLNGDFSYTENMRDVAVVRYEDQKHRYIAIASAYNKDGYDKLNDLKIILLISFVFGVLISFFVGLIFSRNLVGPIQTITNKVKEISSQNLSRRIDLREPKDELFELSSTFNELLNRLQESFEIQRRFIANASHELSTPLTSISSQLEITLQNDRNEEEYKSIILSVYEDVRNLTQLTRGLLEMAKASGTSDGIELSLIRIDELLLKLPSELRKADNKYTVDLHFETFPEDEDMLYVFGNIDLLYSAIKNIVLNACKYSRSNKADVFLDFSEDQLRIKILDDGPGIKKEESDLIFQPFYRGVDVKIKQGFGLGLSLASRIIKLHKGNIAIEDQQIAGTCFVIVLPIGRSFHAI